MVQALSAYALIATNLIIILSAELVGGGRFFYESGLIQAFSLFFIFLASTRIFKHYFISDPTLLLFLRKSLLALTIFAAAELFEVGNFLLSPAQAHGANHGFAVGLDKVNLDIIGLILFIVGTEFLISGAKPIFKKNRRSKLLARYFPTLVLLFFVSFSIYILLNESLLSFSIANPIIIVIYALLTSTIAIYGSILLRRAGECMPALRKFSRGINDAFMLIALATIIQMFNPVLVVSLGIPIHQVDYFSHFAFFAAMSLAFIAFGSLGNLSGIYKDLKEEEIKVSMEC